ncbi:Alpha-2,8-sialyltransferase 8E [Triplophysa tibetana]|uniref:Alpha-2,8-sialyltransferase 8E n=2 Tax=Triplophysa tibetana TaxID=1572043 RepID=A0A5A9NEA3_9TELE|nr:Alpha-2,8-sialyltransferase 8E [Triplophysa tibetana]
MDQRCLTRIFVLLSLLITFTILYIVFFEINTTTRVLYGLPRVHCMELRHKFSIITPDSNFDIMNFTEDLSFLMSCPPVSNITIKELHRVRLRSCCNATGVLYFTKQNTAVNDSIPYETNSKRSYKVNTEVHGMLPEVFPWRKRALGRCAVVGSGGILNNSSCGREIDSADYVIRFNMAPINDSDVGLKTDLLTVNPSQLTRFKIAKVGPDLLVHRLIVYGNSSIIIPAFSYSYNTQLAINTLKVLRPIIPHQQIVFFSPNYLKKLSGLWKGRGLKVTRLSTGFMLINVALELCDHVHVYGFWPFDINLQQQDVPHHYYDNVGPKQGVHSMPKEFLNLLQLHSQGALTLHLQPCS